jgi:hypothetical protein
MSDSAPVADAQYFETIEERFFSPHHMLMRMAGEALFASQRTLRPPLKDEHLLTAMLMSALAVEALCNAVGHRVVAGWEDYEQIPAWSKIRLLCTTLNIAYDRGAQPWQRLQALLAFRNQVAHGKAEHIRHRRVLTAKQADAALNGAPTIPPAKLEAKLTLENALIAFATAREVEKILTENVPLELKLGLIVEGGTYTARPMTSDEVTAEQSQFVS